MTLHDYTPYECEVLHLLASIRWACWLMATAVAGGAVMIALALRILVEKEGFKASKQMFAFSILYLFLLFAVLLADRMSGGLLGHFAT